jgi:hypothetical protein
MEMAKLVCEHATKLRHAQGLEQGEAETHYTAAPKSHYAASIRDPSIHLGSQIYLGWHGLLRRRSDPVQYLEKLRMVLSVKGGTRRDEMVRTRQDRPQNGAGPYDAEQNQVDMEPPSMGPYSIGDIKQGSRNGHSEHIEANH